MSKYLRRAHVRLVLTALITGALVSGCSKPSATDAGQTTAAATGGPLEAATTAPGTTSASGSAEAIPVYPGATLNTGEGGSVPDRPLEKGVFYETNDDGPTVAAWYEAHVPSNWTRSIGAPGKKIAGLFSSPDQNQIVMVTGGTTGTEIQFTINAPSK